MKKLVATSALAIAVLGSVGVAQGATRTVVVDGVDNPFLANQPRGTKCCGDDHGAQRPVLALHPRLTCGDTLSFSTAGGASYQPGSLAPSADGFTNQQFDMTADYGTGISGPLHVYAAGLVGVFTTEAVPSGPAPQQLDSGVNFDALSPGLFQIFWIGDGLTKTGKGVRQKFIVPAGATRLYLGIADGYQWSNNIGQIVVIIHHQHLAMAPPRSCVR